MSLRNQIRMIRHTVVASLVFGLSSVSAFAVGTWTRVTASAPNANGGVMLVLSDGSVICKTSAGGTDGIGNTWNKLTPNAQGSYIGGTWSTIAPMYDTRLYFSSQVLMDGRVYVAGGEYGTGGQAGEVYDPVANTWTRTPAPSARLSDANTEMLPDGRVLQALVAGTLKSTQIYNPLTNTYSTGPTCNGIHNESVWMKLPDASILFVDRGATTSDRYIPSRNVWMVDGTVPVALFDAYGLETGGAAMLPNGKAFFLGSTSGRTGLYTPSNSTTKAGVWSTGPVIPGNGGGPDAPLAMMSDGKVLCTVSPSPTSANHFPSPTSFYEYDYATNAFTQVNAPSGSTTLNTSTYVLNMVCLPDGKVLFSQQGSTVYYVYTPSGTPLAQGKPTITGLEQDGCGQFRLIGTQFNGISEGASYGDDWQMNTNFPIVRLTSGSNVYYCRSYNWNSTGIMTGALETTTKFKVPAGLPAGSYSLVVTANGIASDPIAFDYTPYRSADLDGDGIVSAADVSVMLLDFGDCAACAADLDFDGQVTAGDVGLALLFDGPCF
jgi:hypothetical protein